MANKVFDLDGFIRSSVTERSTSLLQQDLEGNHGELAKAIDGRRVLVIGGAGTIGSSFIRALLRFHPAALYVVDTDENGLTELTRDLRSRMDCHVPPEYLTYPMDFGSQLFQRWLSAQATFDIVANFAAHKHVRSEKDVYSIQAMLENNVLKARRLLDQLALRPPQHFFCVSTDKAANPVNVMGASKKLMEDLIMSYADRFKITTARFANVAFSNGSLLAGFLQRMVKKQPLSAPVDVRRYFVSPDESGQLCLLACILGESGDIIFPKLRAEQMRTFDGIAVAFLAAYGGFEADRCASEEEARSKARELREGSKHYPVYFSPSSTSGEKSYEEFYVEGEDIDWNRFNQLGVVKLAQPPSPAPVLAMIEKLETAATSSSATKEQIVTILTELIPNFEHLETGKSLDQKM